MNMVVEKITIPAHSSHLRRPRLLSLLQASLGSCSASILNGRAGTGKSVLAEDCARNCGRNVAWYKVEGSDGDPGTFFQYLLSSIRQQRRGFRQEKLGRLVQTAMLEDFPQLAEVLVYELLEAQGEPLLIVIEDLHAVYDSKWVVPFFSRLLPLLPADVHLLITGRSLPPAPLWRMRSKQSLLVVEEPELAFTLQEAINLFQRYGLSEEHASVALEHSHGRAAIMARFVLTLSSSGKAVAESFVATERRQRRLYTPNVHGYSF